MKIEIEIPDRFDERNLRVMAGVELVAMRSPGGKWRVKTVSCNLCGKCCMDLPPNSGKGRSATDQHAWPPTDETGRCIFLEMEPDGIIYRCGLGINRPTGCSFSDPIDRDYCCIEWEEVE